MDNRLRVGVVGCGIGRSHIQAYRNLPEMFEVVAICDLDKDKAREVASQNGIPNVLTDLDVLCGMGDIDVIDVCTPSYLHSEHVLLALAGGKYVVCEKPVAGSLQAVDDLLRAERDAGKRVMPIYQNRFGHGLQKLRLLIDEGLAGKAYLTTVETAWRRRQAYYDVPWRGRWATELGGPLVTLAIHAHDVLTYVIGPAQRVFAHAATRVNPIETEDCLGAVLEMADGSLATLAVTTGSADEISRLRFCFEGLTAESTTAPYACTRDPWRFTADSPEDEQRVAETLGRFDPLPEGFEGQFYRFYHAIQQGSDPPVTLGDARASLELITALYYSVETGEPVPLPIGTDHPRYVSWRPE
ncbi:MAG: Gfo/Idh/MocA family oxidoreductase [Chloroflexi bacterium]|nr:Gfo/Idh/MocA family oxidoreductase [Chloroflexota bacterium]